MNGIDPRTESSPAELPGFVSRVIGAAGDRDGPLLRRLVKDLSPPDLASVLAQMPGEAMRHLVRLIGAELPAETWAYLPWQLREEALTLLPAEIVARTLAELDTDDAVAVAEELGASQLEAVLAVADEDVRLAVQDALSFDEETAGRLMQREFVAAPDGARVGEVIDRMRSDSAELPELFFEIYIVDARMQPVGAVPVSTLLRAQRDVPLRSIMRALPLLIRPQMDQEDVAVAFQKYHLASAPVVDEAGRLKGMVTVDDIVDVIQEEGQEDLLKLSGVSDASRSDGVADSVRARAPWILVNLGTALVASTIISRFSGAIETIVALAVLMPIVASMGGNAGTQALAVAVRAIAARELTAANAPRFVLREALTGMVNGLGFAVLVSVLALVWFHSPGLALAIGLAVMINFTCAGLAGVLVPLTLRRFGADPAVSSSVFVTFVTDVVGFFAFLGLASLILLG